MINYQTWLIHQDDHDYHQLSPTYLHLSAIMMKSPFIDLLG